MNKVIKAVKVQLAPEHIDEALGLVLLAPEDRLDELLRLHEENSGNIFCMCLDSIKYNLVKDGKITKDKFPNFGAPFI